MDDIFCPCSLIEYSNSSVQSYSCPTNTDYTIRVNCQGIWFCQDCESHRKTLNLSPAKRKRMSEKFSMCLCTLVDLPKVP
jgi:ribosomal protein L37AE/L43A